MTRIAKYIDDGRLRMKPNCIILSDVALRTKALNVLFSYNRVWLRLGLAIVLGPIAFSNEKESTLNAIEHEGEILFQTTFMKVLIEEHFFGDSPLAKQFATNRSIDGLYRDGYKEALGKIILKRIFLLILVLDKIKIETALDGQHGIDGLDGGSPLLFQPNACVKSSRQALEDFLSHVMQGEGDLIVHVGKVGYHVSHIQAPLSEFNFEVRNVMDLQDGVRLCRLAQLMSHDLSVLGKVKFPCQAPKKRTRNCELGLKTLGQSGVRLEDESGAPITAENIASGHRKKLLSLIWNVILHLQVPHLVQAARTIQHYWQRYQIRRTERRIVAATVIQASWRGHLVRNLLSQRLLAAHTIQRHLRGYIGRKRIQKRLAAALLIQKFARGYTLKLSYRLRLMGAKRLQALFRGALVRLHARRDANNITKIQAVWRGCCARRLLNRWRAAASLIQCHFRGYNQRKHYKTLMDRIAQIQAAFRVVLIRKKLRLENHAAEQIQSGWHRYKMRRASREKQAAARWIQSRYRCFRQRRWYQSYRSSVISLQAIVRGHLVWKRFRDVRVAVIILQSRWRGCLARRTLEVEKLAAIRIQKHVRSYVQFRRNRQQNLRHAAITIQSLYRGYVQRKLYHEDRLAIVRIQSYWRRHVQKRIQKSNTKDIVAATVIQASWRGHLVRNLLSQRSLAAHTIRSQGHRLTEALAQLLSEKTVSGTLNACAIIDMASEHSKQCCERLVEGGAVKKVLMLIRTLNRSLPHEQVLKHALSILGNLARFPDLALSIAGEAGSINTIVEQLLVFRNKNEVFSKAMKILLLVCRTPGCVNPIPQDEVVIRRLHKIAVLLERRFEVEKRNLEKLPPSTPSLVRRAADRKLRDTVMQKQSIMSIMPTSQNGLPRVPLRDLSIKATKVVRK